MREPLYSSSSPLHIGMVIEEDFEPGYAKVWIPTANSYVPLGFSEYMYKNTGGQLYGENLSLAQGTAYRCRIASSLSSGAWWKANAGKTSSVFDDYSDNPLTYQLYPYSQSSHSSSIHSYRLPTDNPKVTGAVSTTTLSVTGGNSTHTIGTMPKGKFVKLKANQWVVVGFLHTGTNPIILSTMQSDEAWNVVMNGATVSSTVAESAPTESNNYSENKDNSNETTDESETQIEKEPRKLTTAEMEASIRVIKAKRAADAAYVERTGGKGTPGSLVTRTWADPDDYLNYL